MAAKRLTDKQRRLIAEYAVDRNVKASALRAGYSTHAARRIGELIVGVKACDLNHTFEVLFDYARVDDIQEGVEHRKLLQSPRVNQQCRLNGRSGLRCQEPQFVFEIGTQFIRAVRTTDLHPQLPSFIGTTRKWTQLLPYDKPFEPFARPIDDRDGREIGGGNQIDH